MALAAALRREDHSKLFAKARPADKGSYSVVEPHASTTARGGGAGQRTVFLPGEVTDSAG